MLRGKPKRAKTRGLRIYFATDLHGSEVCFRKFLAAARVYEADVIILGGDFAGKAIVPVLTEGGSLRARVGGEEITVPEAEWDRLVADIGKSGAVPGADGRRRAGPALRRSRASSTGCSAARSRRRCSAGATWPPSGSTRPVRCIITPGNDDPVDADAVLAAHGRVECPELELCDLGPVTMASLGVVPTTPWNTERECTEDELAKQISDMLDGLPDGRPCILNLHCPPYASGLDDAPELDATLKPVIRGGRPSIVPVGSHAVREAIKRYQPVVGLHGHIHESRGAQKIGRTLCVNPGSDYSSGVLRGAVIDIAQDGSCLDFLLTTG